MEIYIGELSNDVPYELDSNYKFIEKIANGSFGTVIHVIDINTDEELAIKVINKLGCSPESIRKMKEEITILKQLQHENIVQFYGYEETNSKLLIMMEYLKYGTLSQWMKKNNNKITEENASIIIHKILNATDYLHNKQICHRDIKPENIMLSNENDLSSIKLIDFGLSEQNLFNPLIDGYCGTLLYMSPEQIEKKSYSQTVDIWSIGIILFMLLNNNKHPFYIKGIDKKVYCEKIKKGNFTYFNNLSYMAKNLISKLLEPNPSWRYTSDKAIRHPWITRNKNDPIPKTFNEILSFKHNLTNKKNFLLISIFLNYCKKHDEMFNEKLPLMDEIIHYKKNKKKKNPIYNISYDYINKCNYYSMKIKEKLNKEKLCSFDIIDDELENSKNNKTNDILIKRRKSSSPILDKEKKYKIKPNIKIENDNIEFQPKLLKELSHFPRKSVINIHHPNLFNLNNLEINQRNSLYLKTENDKQLNIKKTSTNIISNIRREEKKNFSPINQRNRKLYLSKSPIKNRNEVFPKLYHQKKVITLLNDNEDLNIVPLVLPQIPVSNRITNSIKIGNFE